jgi:hypothetical protein
MSGRPGIIKEVKKKINPNVTTNNRHQKHVHHSYDR